MNPSFQGVNRLFVLLFENKNDTAGYTGYFLPVLEIKDYNFMIDGQNFFDQPVKNDLRTYDNIRKFMTGPGVAYRTVFLLDYLYFKKYCKMIAIDLSKKLKSLIKCDW